jgi:hypothetical protein
MAVPSSEISLCLPVSDRLGCAESISTPPSVVTHCGHSRFVDGLIVSGARFFLTGERATRHCCERAGGCVAEPQPRREIVIPRDVDAIASLL